MTNSPQRAEASSRATRGTRFPLGATWTFQGTNFSVFSREAIGMELLLYSPADAVEPTQVIRLDPRFNHTFFFWHVFVADLPAGIAYNWRVQLPAGSEYGTTLEVLDPFARAIVDAGWARTRRQAAPAGGSLALRSLLVDTEYNWAGDRPVRHDLRTAVIYEMHIGHFTRHPSAGARQPGSFAAAIDKIPYLQSLGITHVQLMPVAAYDEQDVPPEVAARGLRNVWGYSPYAFCAPHPAYCDPTHPGNPVDQFRDLVKALHAAGIGVILDVVFNHTAEGGEGGPVINHKGLTGDIFYHRDPPPAPGQPRPWRDYTGCGNTVNCNHPLVAMMLVRCLENWVEECRIDGFRFDLASVFARGEDGEPLHNPPLPWNIEFSRRLAELPMIAEAWDAVGLYQLGNFPGLAWTEWNGRYRDVMRRFVRGDAGLAGEVASCLAGSSDLYQPSGRRPANSINFITCHDGFTLADLVSYNEKHNEPNGEGNRDGGNHDFSWNGGIEGPTSDPAINALREQQARNFMAILLLSQGVPMLLAGDEVLRSQRGNNNAWCQDDESVWFDWSRLESQAWMVEFTRGMIALRRRHPTLMRTHFLAGEPEAETGLPDIRWHGRALDQPPWHDPESRLLAFTLARCAEGEEDLHVILNMQDEPAEFALPAIPGRHWYRAVDTGCIEGRFVLEREQQPVVSGRYACLPRSVVVLEAR